MHAYILEKQRLRKNNTKKVHYVTKHSYHTNGKIDLNYVRNNIPGYQTVTIFIDESIDLPTPGSYPIKIKVDQKWYNGIAILNKSFDSNQLYSRTIKVFIKDKLEKPINSEVAMTWYFHIENK